MDEYLKIMLECGKMIIEGITVEDVKMPFTLIDYYNLAEKEINGVLNHDQIRSLAIRYRYKYKISDRYLNTFINFFNKELLVGDNVDNAKEIIDQKYSFTFNDNKYVPTYTDVQMIMNLFDIYNVPKNHRLIYQALHRVARDFPIFPLLIPETEKKLGK